MEQDALTADDMLTLLRLDAERPAIVHVEHNLPAPAVKYAFATAAPAPRVYARPELLRDYKTSVPYLEQWAGMPVILVTSDDLPAALTAEARKLRDDYLAYVKTRGPHNWTDAEKATQDKFKADGELIARAAARPVREMFTHLTGGAHLKDDGGDIFSSIITGEANAQTVKDRAGQEYCLIRTFDEPIDERKIFGMVADLRKHPAALTAPIGTINDWRTIVMAHEAAHCRLHNKTETRRSLPDWAADGPGAHKTQYTEGRLAREIEADRFAVAAYDTLAATDKNLSPDVPRHFMAARALSALFLHGRRGTALWAEKNDHASGPALPDASGHTPRWHGDTNRFADMDALLSALDRPAFASSLLIAHVMAPAPGNDRILLPTESCAGYINVAFARCVNRPVATTGDKVAAHYYDARLYGGILAGQNPALRVAALTALDDAGIFATDPVAASYVAQFRAAIRAYTPFLADPVLIARFNNALAAEPGLAARLLRDAPAAASAHKYCPDGYPRPPWKPGPDCQ